ncbi:hypothetical protein scyTo_0000379 [Scyliorhinus torazame]|uniref:Uncharacterized protein n=1 Tax=Scyliorhinus torazame TaxID=75743 RepID=A0A401NW60_SCYTO|nr:hypothetical protein [Scyliorhinus torazame]
MAFWMMCSVLKAGRLCQAAPLSPLEISGDQTPPEFRDGLERNRNFVFQIWNTIQTLLEMDRLENPYLFEDQLGLLAESQHLMSVQMTRCTQTDFQLVSSSGTLYLWVWTDQGVKHQ